MCRVFTNALLSLVIVLMASRCAVHSGHPAAEAIPVTPLNEPTPSRPAPGNQGAGIGLGESAMIITGVVVSTMLIGIGGWFGYPGTSE